MSNSSWPHGLQHTRLSCPSPSPGACSNSCPLTVMPSNHLILYHLLPPSILPSIRIFSNESVLHITWPKCWGFSFSISPSNEYSGLISFRIDWLDLRMVLNSWNTFPRVNPRPKFWWQKVGSRSFKTVCDARCLYSEHCLTKKEKLTKSNTKKSMKAKWMSQDTAGPQAGGWTGASSWHSLLPSGVPQAQGGEVSKACAKGKSLWPAEGRMLCSPPTKIY